MWPISSCLTSEGRVPDQGNSGERKLPNIFDTDDLIDEFDRDDDVSDLIIDAEEATAARSATTAASPVASSSEPSGSASCSSASPLQATIQRRPTPHSTSWRCWSTPPAPARSTVSCSAVHHPMRPPTSVPVRPRRSRRQPTRSMPTRSSSTTNSPRPSNTTSRRFSAGRRSIAPPSFSTFSPRTPAARRARPRWNSLSCATASAPSLKRTHLLPAGRRYRYQGPG